MNNNISSIEYLDKKLAEIFHPISPHNDYIDRLHSKLKHRESVLIDKPYYYAFIRTALLVCAGLIIFLTLKRIYKILSR